MANLVIRDIPDKRRLAHIIIDIAYVVYVLAPIWRQVISNANADQIVTLV